MKIILFVCLVLIVALLPGLSLAQDENSASPAIAQYVNEISQATH